MNAVDSSGDHWTSVDLRDRVVSVSVLQSSTKIAGLTWVRILVGRRQLYLHFVDLFCPGSTPEL